MQEIEQSDIATWPDEYESILEFYFWEPQHLNRFSPAPDRRLGLDAVLARLRKREVPLNHLFSIFFSLVPSAMAARLLTAVAPGIEGGSAYLINSPAFRRSKLRGICQPDLLLIVDDRPVFWELKIDSTTSEEQLLKYALLGELVTQKSEKAPALVLVGRTAAFPAADTFENLRATELLHISTKFERHASDFGVTRAALRAAARRIALFRTSYTAIHGHLASELKRVDAESESGQTLSKLLHGMVVTLENIQPRHRRPVTRK
jgi:hypothetical protein